VSPLPAPPISAPHTELLERYRLHQERRYLMPASIYRIHTCLRSWIRWLEPEKEPWDATKADVELFLDKKRNQKGQKLNGRTRYYWIAHLHTFYVWAMAENLTEADPTVLVVRPKMRQVLPRPIDSDALADAIRGSRSQMRAMLLLAALGGLRCQEIAGLERDDVIEAKGLLRIRFGKGAKERIVPLHPDVLEALRMLPMPTSGYLFRRPRGGRHLPASVSVAIKTYLREECGIDATAHQLRHWHATEIYAQTKDIRLTQELLGHSNPATTAMYIAYSHVDAAAAVRALRIIPGSDSPTSSTGTDTEQPPPNMMEAE
jgi:integrase